MAKRPYPSHDEVMASCNAVARQTLLGRRIVEVRYLNSDECNQLMWSQTSVVLVLDNGTTVYAARRGRQRCRGLARRHPVRRGVRAPRTVGRNVADKGIAREKIPRSFSTAGGP